MGIVSVPSGAEVTINLASWEAAKALKKAIEREIAGNGGLNLATVLMVDSSDAVDAALMTCLARCLYNKEKITSVTFDKAEARGDYYDIAIACVKENLGPLAESLLSKLNEYGLMTKQAEAKKDPKSPSETISTSQP